MWNLTLSADSRTPSMYAWFLLGAAFLCASSRSARGQVFVLGSDRSIGEYSLSGDLLGPKFTTTVSGPGGLAVVGNDLFVSDNVHGNIHEYANGTEISTPLSTNAFGGGALASEGNTIFMAQNGYYSQYNNITDYDASSGDVINSSLIVGGIFPWCMAVEGNDLFVASDTFNPTTHPGFISEYNTDGTLVNASLITGLPPVYGLAVEGDDLFVPNFNSHTISEYKTDGTLVNASFISDPNLPNPNALAVLGNNLYVASSGSGYIGEYTTSGQVVNDQLIFAGTQIIPGLVVVPEPSSITLLAAAAALLIRIRTHRPHAPTSF